MSDGQSVGGAYQGPSSSGGGGYPGAGHQGSPTHFGGADAVDFQAMLEAMQSDKAQQESRYQELEGRHKETSQVLDRLKSALVGGKEELSPIDQKIASYEQQLEHYMQAAIEAERRGQPIPLTTNLAIQLFQGRIEQERERERFAQEIAALKRATAQANDPQTQIDNQTFQNLDSHVLNAMDTLYGKAPNDVKSYQFQAVTKALGAEIKDLKRNDPELWSEITRDPRRQERMVQHFVKQTIPPKAREILMEDQIRREPMTTAELYSAFRETANIEDPNERQRIRVAIRQEIVGRQFGGQ